MSSDLLDKLVREVSDFEALEQDWPRDWSIDEVEDRIDEHDEVMNEAEKHGLRRLGAGGFRVVFEVLPENKLGLKHDTVLKISKYDGTRQNADSIGMYENLNEGAKQYVADIVDWGEDKRWLLQEKATNAKTGDTKAVIEGLAEHGYACSDIRRENCGRINGEPVLVDLALLR